VQGENLARVEFPPWWDGVVRDELLLVQVGNLACTRFPP
jgi:hypothetical protein